MMADASASKRLKDMTLAELKVYLRDQGVTLNGYLKPALVEVTGSVEKMILSIDPYFQNENKSGNKLIIHDMEMQPLSYTVVNNFIDSPSFGLYDIFNFLIYHSTDYDKQGLVAYKSFDDYCLFRDGYVESGNKNIRKRWHAFVCE